MMADHVKRLTTVLPITVVAMKMLFAQRQDLAQTLASVRQSSVETARAASPLSAERVLSGQVLTVDLAPLAHSMRRMMH